MGQPVAWVTGSAGFIGGHVVARLRGEGWRVVGMDRRVVPTDGHLMDVLDASVLDKAFETHGAPALVFHAAGPSAVGDSTRDPAASLRDTIETTEAVVGFLLAHAPQARLIYPSSAAVYGNTDAAVLDENLPPNPMSLYGQHKHAAEQVCLAAAAHGLSVVILRLFSVYGLGLTKQLPWELGRKLLQGDGPVALFGTGSETRDFFNVADVAALILHLAQRNLAGPLIVNGGTGVATRIDQFAALFSQALGVDRAVVFNGQIRPGDPQHFRAATQRLASLDFSPCVDLKTGLTQYADWLKAR